MLPTCSALRHWQNKEQSQIYAAKGDALTERGSAAFEGLSPVTAAESSDSKAASDGQPVYNHLLKHLMGERTVNINRIADLCEPFPIIPVAFLSSADAQGIVDSYAENPSLPRWQHTPMWERSTQVYLPSSTPMFIVRTDACGRTFGMIKGRAALSPGAVRMHFTKHGYLDSAKTKKANPEGGKTQTVERAQRQENFVAKYTTNPRLKLVEVIVKPGTEQVVSANHVDIPPVPPSSGEVACYSESAGPVLEYTEGAASAPGLGAVKAPQPGTSRNTQASAKQRRGPSNWNHGDLAVQCGKGACQVLIGTISTLLIEVACGDTASMRCSILAPKGVKGQRRISFLEEGTKQY